MSEWTSWQDILADLSEAQGCVVPASLQAIGSTEPPRNIRESEDMMTEYMQEVNVKPDLHMIQEMLHLVNGMGDAQEQQHTNRFEDDNRLGNDSTRAEKNKRKLKNNVALTSIIEAKERQEANDLTLIPPMFRKKSEVKKKEIVTSSPETPTEYKPSPQAAEYYKRYMENNKMKTPPYESDLYSSSSSCPSSTPSSSNSPAKHKTQEDYEAKAYIPSAEANNYYRKLVLREKLKKHVKEDIWSRAEREMKKIDEKKLVETLSPQDPKHAALYILSLEDHRHLLAEQCIVCEVAAKHGYTFEESASY